ncbi:MAG: aldehyde dehydrogenase family protein [Elusimicrobia bacterium]|nr:aldehyde dehydrogenase family protein [Elusimicrobiota bacterium]
MPRTRLGSPSRGDPFHAQSRDRQRGAFSSACRRGDRHGPLARQGPEEPRLRHAHPRRRGPLIPGLHRRQRPDPRRVRPLRRRRGDHALDQSGRDHHQQRDLDLVRGQLRRLRAASGLVQGLRGDHAPPFRCRRRRGAPRALITTYDKPSQDNTRNLLAHPDTRVNMVTGGPAIVKVAMTVGKTCKTIAAGPGNPPVVVDETAVFPKCAEDIIFGASFDNNVLCTAEKEVIVVEAARARFLDAMRRDPRAFELSAAQADQLTKLVIKEGGKGCKDPVLNRDYVGKDASVLAKGIGLTIPAEARLLWAEVPNDHALVWTEQLMPFLPVTVARDVDAAIDLAVKAEGGHRHTAAMHSTNVANLTKMARRMQCSIYVKNAPTLYGLGLGEGYATMSIGTPTGDGLTKASHFARPLHCALVGYFRIA